MPPAPRTRPPSAAKPRSKAVLLGADLWLERAREFALPSVAALVVAIAAGVGAAGVVESPRALDVAVLAALVLVCWTGLRSALGRSVSGRDRSVAAALALVWIVGFWVPLHLRFFPGAPLVEKASMSASGDGLPVTIPAAGLRAVDLFLEGSLPPAPAGATAPPVRFRLTLEGGDGTPQTIAGLFQDKLATRRLGRRGTAVVHQTHTADVHVIPNPAREDLRVTQLVLEPPTAQPIRLTAYPHPLPPVPVLAIAALALVAAAVAWDRRGPLPSADGALTYATAAALGIVVIFWTSDTVHPDAQTLIGSAIFGGALGFAAGAAVWWLAKQLIASPSRSR
jgi:hypothetical protein